MKQMHQLETKYQLHVYVRITMYCQSFRNACAVIKPSMAFLSIDSDIYISRNSKRYKKCKHENKVV